MYKLGFSILLGLFIMSLLSEGCCGCYNTQDGQYEATITGLIADCPDKIISNNESLNINIEASLEKKFVAMNYSNNLNMSIFSKLQACKQVYLNHFSNGILSVDITSNLLFDSSHIAGQSLQDIFYGNAENQKFDNLSNYTFENNSYGINYYINTYCDSKPILDSSYNFYISLILLDSTTFTDTIKDIIFE